MKPTHVMGFLLVSLAVLGAGCAAPARSASVDPAGSHWQGPTDCPDRTAPVSFRPADEPAASFDILLNGRVVATLETEDEHEMSAFKTVPGMTFLALDPSGLGGYIPYGGHAALYGVDHCDGSVIEVIPPQGSDPHGFPLQDISADGALAAFVNRDGDRLSIGIMETPGSETPYASPSRYPVPETWDFVGTVRFNPEATKLAFAAGSGPQDERGAVYTLDLVTGRFAKIAAIPKGLPYVVGWDGDDRPVYRVPIGGIDTYVFPDYQFSVPLHVLVEVRSDHVRIQSFVAPDDLGGDLPENASFAEIRKPYEYGLETWKESYESVERTTLNGKAAWLGTDRKPGGETWPGHGYYANGASPTAIDLFYRTPEGQAFAQAVADSFRWK